MAYCSLEAVYHELHPTLIMEMQTHYGDSFEETMQAHIDKAEAFTNASLGRVYSVPLKKATSAVVTIVCKLAAYFSSAAFCEKEDILIDKYRTAMAMLDNLIAAENPYLVDALYVPDAVKTFEVIRYGSDERIFTDDEVSTW